MQSPNVCSADTINPEKCIWTAVLIKYSTETSDVENFNGN